MEEDLETFHNLFIKCLDLVEDDYYKTTYQNIEKYYQEIENFDEDMKNRLDFEENHFHRYGERVFCYELYHQLRIKLDEIIDNNANFLNGAKLQGEFAKWQHEQLLHNFDLEMLSNEFIPDFLLHKAGGFVNHFYVIEVKSNPNLSPSSLLADLKKLNQFITKFRYKRGIFLAINISPSDINRMIEKKSEEIKKLKGKAAIAVITKEKKDTAESITYLHNV